MASIMFFLKCLTRSLTILLHLGGGGNIDFKMPGLMRETIPPLPHTLSWYGLQ